MISIETTLGNLQNEVDQHEKDIREMDSKRNFLTNKQGKLQQEAEQHKEQVQERDVLVKQAAGEMMIIIHSPNVVLDPRGFLLNSLLGMFVYPV